MPTALLQAVSWYVDCLLVSMVRLHCRWCLMCGGPSPAKLLSFLRLVPVIASCAQPGLLSVLCSVIHSLRALTLIHALTHHHPSPPSLPLLPFPLMHSCTHPVLMTSSTDQGGSHPCRDCMASKSISDAWHSPASDRQCRQDSTAFLWRGQTVGLPAGDLPSPVHG